MRISHSHWFVRAIVALALISTVVVLVAGTRANASSKSASQITTSIHSVKTTSATLSTAASKTRCLAFYVDWDPASYTSLSSHYSDITTLSPEWLCWAANGTLVHDSPGSETKVKTLLAGKNVIIEPVLENWDPGNSWDPVPLSVTLADANKSRALAANVTAEVQKNGWKGINIDFEGLPSTSRNDLTNFMCYLYGSMHPLGLEVSIDVGPYGTTWDYASLAQYVDFMVPMLYDEHWSTSGPGPVASQTWFANQLTKLIQTVPASKIVVGTGNYGYQWTTGAIRANNRSFSNAVALAQQLHQPVSLNPSSYNLAFTTAGGSVWFLDAASEFNEVTIASKCHVGGYALWRLGTEDPAVWKVLHSRDSPSSKVALSLQTPKRAVTYDSTSGLITREQILP